MDTPTPTSLDPKFREPLPHMGWGGIIDLVTYGPMGMRSYAMRRRLTKYEARVFPAQLLLLALGPFTCGFSWIGVIALAIYDPSGISCRTRMKQMEEGIATLLD